MTTVFQNAGWWRPSSWIFATIHFQCNRCVLTRSPNVSTKFGEDRSNSREMQQLFEIQDGCSRHLELWLDFRRHRCVLNQSSNIPTKFGDDWSNCKEMATVFWNSRWQKPPSWIFTTMHFRCHQNVTNRCPNVSTNFGDDRSNNEEMAAVFRNPR